MQEAAQEVVVEEADLQVPKLPMEPREQRAQPVYSATKLQPTMAKPLQRSNQSWSSSS